MARTLQQLLEDHIKAVLSGNYEKMLEDYADDALMITREGTFKGKEAIKGVFENLINNMPNMKPVKTSDDRLLIEGDTLLLRWSAESDMATISNAVDTIVVQNDKIWRHTACFEIVRK